MASTDIYPMRKKIITEDEIHGIGGDTSTFSEMRNEKPVKEKRRRAPTRKHIQQIPRMTEKRIHLQNMDQ